MGRKARWRKNQDFEKDFVKLKNVSKIYRMGEVEIRAVDKIEFAIDKGEFVVVVGPSGAGKINGSEHSWWNGYGDFRGCAGRWREYCQIFPAEADRISQG